MKRSFFEKRLVVSKPEVMRSLEEPNVIFVHPDRQAVVKLKMNVYINVFFWETLLATYLKWYASQKIWALYLYAPADK